MTIGDGLAVIGTALGAVGMAWAAAWSSVRADEIRARLAERVKR